MIYIYIYLGERPHLQEYWMNCIWPSPLLITRPVGERSRNEAIHCITNQIPKIHSSCIYLLRSTLDENHNRCAIHKCLETSIQIFDRLCSVVCASSCGTGKLIQHTLCMLGYGVCQFCSLCAFDLFSNFTTLIIAIRDRSNALTCLSYLEYNKSRNGRNFKSFRDIRVFFCFNL